MLIQLWTFWSLSYINLRWLHFCSLKWKGWVINSPRHVLRCFLTVWLFFQLLDLGSGDTTPILDQKTEYADIFYGCCQQITDNFETAYVQVRPNSWHWIVQRLLHKTTAKYWHAHFSLKLNERKEWKSLFLLNHRNACTNIWTKNI